MIQYMEVFACTTKFHVFSAHLIPESCKSMTIQKLILRAKKESNDNSKHVYLFYYLLNGAILVDF